MQSIRNLFTAFANVAASLNALAGVIDAATARLRQQLALDYGGHVLEHVPQGEEEEKVSNHRKGAKR